MRKRFTKVLLACMLTVTFGIQAHAEGEEDTGSGELDFSDSTYWNNLCTGSDLSTEDKSSCSAYMQYISNQTSSLSQAIQDIEAQREEIAEKILEYAALVQDYQAQADALNSEIADLNAQISVSEKKIEELETKITETEAEIDEAEEKVKNRMVAQQKTMRLNQYLDLLMGASSFDEMMRVANGLSDITKYDTNTMEQLATLIEEMNADKAEVEAEKEKLDADKQTIVDKQNELLTLKYQAQVIEEEYQKQSADLEALGNKYASDIAAIQETMAAISSKLNEVVATAGWTYPVPGVSINPSAGTWYYSSGGVHLGADFSGSAGSSILAVGNGVILFSTDGCDSYGYLGNGCGSNIGGSWGGGNQAYLLTKINGGLYAVKYLHMLAGSVIASGSIVVAGQQIGQVGSSGNSTGPHCHIEVFYLGDASNFTSYAQNWDGDLAFGCGWSSSGLNRLCENGVGAPCRVKPESLFGG